MAPLIISEIGANNNGQITLYKGRGCDVCKETGYKGRSGIHELLIVNDEIKNEIIKRSPSHILRDLAIKNGMKSLQTDAMLKVLMGLTTVEEVVRVIYA